MSLSSRKLHHLQCCLLDFGRMLHRYSTRYHHRRWLPNLRLLHRHCSARRQASFWLSLLSQGRCSETADPTPSHAKIQGWLLLRLMRRRPLPHHATRHRSEDSSSELMHPSPRSVPRSNLKRKKSKSSSKALRNLSGTYSRGLIALQTRRHRFIASIISEGRVSGQPLQNSWSRRFVRNWLPMHQLRHPTQ